ncbi:MAG TPA: hypothetical protein VHV54_03705 [Candidatus Binatia bacterium]|nr:hypothetical protein [Candidatus Binatia bacterium]
MKLHDIKIRIVETCAGGATSAASEAITVAPEEASVVGGPG